MAGFDPGVAEAMEVARGLGARPYEEGSPARARAVYDALGPLRRGPAPLVAEVAEVTLGAGGDAFRLRLYRGQGAPQRAPALLYLHGGGWVLGDMESHRDICCRLANLAGCVVAYPDYRRAPEARFPAAVEDTLLALDTLHRRGAEFGIDPARIATGGDSAGGNLAAVAAIAARDRGLRLTAQLLFYPNTDARQGADSYRRHATGFGLTAATMRWFRDLYLAAPEQALDWRASPLLAPDLSGLAPAAVLLAGQDILHDEGLDYARALRAAGTPVELRVWPGQIHGFLSLGGLVPVADQALAHAVACWRRFDPGFGPAGGNN